MFEPLISSRIRRSLLEYILAHPTDRFYLRGLSKELGLTVSPLRRELKRLEHSGMLKAIPEGNMLFYQADTASAAFLQLRSLQSGDVVSAAPTAAIRELPALPALKKQFPMFFPAVGFAALLLAVVYLSVAHQRTQPQVTVVVPPAATSGVMQGAKWRVVPGGFGGGFSSDTRGTY